MTSIVFLTGEAGIGKTTGALRASIGLATNFADVYRYVQFARSFVDRQLSSY